MMSVAAGIIFAGYTLTYWGVSMVRSCPTSFGDLLVPGRYKGCAGTAPKVDNNAPFMPAPATQRAVGGTYTNPTTGQQTTSPPSTEGYMSRVPK